jgi:hypothetical protein
MSFVVGSYQAIEHPGAGHRAGPTSLWRGEDLRSGDEVAMTLLPVDSAEAARAAVATVGVIRHPHLLPVIEVVVGVVARDDERVAMVCPWPAAGRLAELLARRGRLSFGETLTVLIPLADALAAAHAGGIRHGDVCPESIWFDGQGRPLLGALAVSAVVADLNDGLPEGSRDVAPEVVRGAAVRRGPVTRAADVFSLGSVALCCLTGRSAWPADDAADVLVQSAAGVWPDPTDDAGPTPMVELIRAMLRADPGRRPSAAGVAAGLSRIAGASPIVFASGPAPTPASANRWRGWSSAPRGSLPAAELPAAELRAAELRAAESPVGGSPVVEPPGGGSLPVGPSVVPPSVVQPSVVRPNVLRPGAVRSGVAQPGSVDSTPVEPTAELGADEPPGAGDHRGRRRGASPLVRTGIALLVGLLITVIAVQVGLWWTGWDSPTSTAGQSGDQAAGAVDGSSVAGAHDWLGVVVDLDAARGRALAAADPALLADVYVQASPAAIADQQTIARLADQGLRVQDGRHEIVSVTPVDAVAADAPNAPSVRLTVVDVLPTHPVLDAAGQQVGVTPGRSAQRRVLVLSATDNGYRINTMEPG